MACVGLFTVLLLVSQATTSSLAGNHLRAALRLLEDQQLNMHRIELQYEVDEVDGSTQISRLRDKDRSINHWEFTFIQSDGKMRLEQYQVDRRKGTRRLIQIDTYDGQICDEFQPVTNDGAIFSNTKLFPPTYWNYVYGENKGLYDILKAHLQQATPEMIVIGGRSRLAVSWPAKAGEASITAILDPKLNYQLASMRREVELPPNLRHATGMVRQVYAIAIEAYSDIQGISLPVQARNTFAYTDPNDHNTIIIDRKVKLKRATLDLPDMPEDQFEIKFPPGTHVSNEDLSMSYIEGEAPEETSVPPIGATPSSSTRTSNVRPRVTSTNSVSGGTADTDVTPPAMSSARNLWYVVIMVLGGALLIAVVIRLRRTPQS